MLTTVALLTLSTPTTIDEVDYLRDVHPILESSCIECHGPKKQKGKLRLDQRSGLFEGDEDFIPVVPGKPDASYLLELVQLPHDDPDIMPAEGDPLTKEQIDVLRRWIEQGASYEAPAGVEEESEPKDTLALAALDDTQVAARDAAAAALGKRGVAPMKVAAGLEALDLNVSLLRDKAGDAEAGMVAGLEPVLVWANFSGTALTDKGLETLGSCAELRRLNLSKTQVTDAGLVQLAGLSKLTYLNLYGTKITDAGLAHLQGLKSLEKIFLWQTEVTDEGVERLVASIPDLRVNRGASLVSVEIERETPVNLVCPVTNKGVDAAVTSAVDGKLVAFCCSKCKATFDADPSKFTDKIPELKVAAGPANDKCPVSGEAVDASITSDFDGKSIAFCCETCKGKFDADPKKFAAKVAELIK